jgi:hypothetical protein
VKVVAELVEREMLFYVKQLELVLAFALVQLSSQGW